MHIKIMHANDHDLEHLLFDSLSSAYLSLKIIECMLI